MENTTNNIVENAVENVVEEVKEVKGRDWRELALAGGLVAGGAIGTLVVQKIKPIKRIKGAIAGFRHVDEENDEDEIVELQEDEVEVLDEDSENE